MNQGRIIVITGAPGTGKTTTASAVAKELNSIIIVVSKSAPSILCYTPTLKTTLKKLFSGI